MGEEEAMLEMAVGERAWGRRVAFPFLRMGSERSLPLPASSIHQRWGMCPCACLWVCVWALPQTACKYYSCLKWKIKAEKSFDIYWSEKKIQYWLWIKTGNKFFHFAFCLFFFWSKFLKRIQCVSFMWHVLNSRFWSHCSMPVIMGFGLHQIEVQSGSTSCTKVFLPSELYSMLAVELLDDSHINVFTYTVTVHRKEETPATAPGLHPHQPAFTHLSRQTCMREFACSGLCH